MRIAIVCENDALSACTRYRADQFAPLLAERLGEVDVLTPRVPTRRGSGHWGRIRFFGGHMVQYLVRTRDLMARIPAYDALLVQRAAYPLGPSAVCRALLRFDGRLVLDLDDAVFLPRPTMSGRGAVTRWLYGPGQTMKLLERADAVVAGSRELAAGLTRQGGHNVTVLPTVLDVSRYPRATHGPRTPLSVGWVGTAGNRMYLDPLAPVFARLAADGVATLEVVSSEPWVGPAGFRRWSEADEARVFSRYDVTIMPLPETPYTRAKAGFKLLQSLAAGVGVVASPVGVNSELIQRSRAGLLADEPNEWDACLRRLASDTEVRAELGDRGRAFAERYCDLEAHAATLASLLAP